MECRPVLERDAAQMEVVVRAMLGADESGAGLLMAGERAPSAGEIARLQEMFPDG